MGITEIREAGRTARELASAVFNQMKESDVPTDYFDEVVEILKELIEQDAKEQPAVQLSQAPRKLDS